MHDRSSERIASTRMTPAIATVIATSDGVFTNQSNVMRYDPALKAKCSRIV